jgi:hypothetical protein
MTDCVACGLSVRTWATLNASDVVEAPARPAGAIVPAMSPNVAKDSPAKCTRRRIFQTSRLLLILP